MIRDRIVGFELSTTTSQTRPAPSAPARRSASVRYSGWAARGRCSGISAVYDTAYSGASRTRSRHDQIEPAEDHRRWHRLALSQRAETRAESVSGKGGYLMLLPTRRRSVTGLAQHVPAPFAPSKLPMSPSCARRTDGDNETGDSG